MDANKISSIMDKYNKGELNKVETSLLLIIEAGCDSDGVLTVFKIYSKKPEDKE